MIETTMLCFLFALIHNTTPTGTLDSQYFFLSTSVEKLVTRPRLFEGWITLSTG